MPARRTPFVAGVLTSLVTLAGCGSQTAPEAAAPPSQNSSEVPGTRPSVSTETPVRATADPSSPTTAPSPTSSTPRTSTDSFTVTDQTSGDFVTGLDNGDVVIAAVGIHGLGLAWSTRRVQVTHSAQGAIARYDGFAKLQRGASLKLGIASVPSLVHTDLGEPEPVRLRFVVRIDPDGVGHADVWLDGHHARLVVAEPPHTAGPVVTAVVSAFRAENWSALYDLTVHFPGQSRRDFIREFGSDGSIEELEVTGDTVYRVVDGVGRALTPAHVVATVGQRHLDRGVAVELVYRDGRWLFSSLAKHIDGD
jgi:hypothetical protein